MVQRAQDRPADERQHEIAPQQHLQQALGEVLEMVRLIRREFDGGGVVLQDMIGVPTLDQLVEAVVFDVPSLVPKTDGACHGKLRRR